MVVRTTSSSQSPAFPIIPSQAPPTNTAAVDPTASSSSRPSTLVETSPLFGSPFSVSQANQSPISNRPSVNLSGGIDSGIGSSSNGAMERSEIHSKIMKGYDYPKSYQRLLDYIKVAKYTFSIPPTRMKLLTLFFFHWSSYDRSNVLRIIKALAAFRPNILSLLSLLGEDDLALSEKCFQRSLIVGGLLPTERPD